MKIKYTDLSKLAYGINESWYIFNATRPIYGHKDWQDATCFGGWFFAGVDPNRYDAKAFISELEAMDAALVKRLPSFDVILNDAQEYADAKGYDVNVHDLDRNDVLDFWLHKLAQKDVDICEL